MNVVASKLEFSGFLGFREHWNVVSCVCSTVCKQQQQLDAEAMLPPRLPEQWKKQRSSSEYSLNPAYSLHCSSFYEV